MSPLFTMKLPDKKAWAEEFVKSKKYEQLIRCINNIPDPDFVPVWDITKLLTNVPPRHRYYTKKIIPLTSFYFIDYINEATNNGIITNICEGNNYFAGTFNIKNCDGSDTFVNKNPIKFTDHVILGGDVRFDNAISICENFSCNLKLLADHINQFINCINYSETQGYGYIAFESYVLRARTKPEFILKNNLDKFYKLNMFIDSVIESFADKVDIIKYENELAETVDDINPVDGDIRLLFKTKPSAMA